jgi:hypothetical protein
VVIATRHAKAKAIRPAFRRLGLSVQTVRADTDALGTFSGEVERKGGALECALEKCRLAHASSGEPYCIGSEGSFGPHPHLPFAASDFEVLAFTDFSRGYSVHEQVIVFETNFAFEDIGTAKALKIFAERTRFPSHALMMRSLGQGSEIIKGIRHWQLLYATYERLVALSPTGQVRVETDMRAHVNPTRMRVIRSLARRLASRLANVCAECGAAGYGLIDTKPGLPCSWCGRPTKMIAREIHGCAVCGQRSYEPRRDGLKQADPAHCDYCNP